MNNKKKLFLLLFSGEIVLLIIILCIGSEGLPKIIALKQEHQQLQYAINKTEQEILDLEKTIYRWNSFVFYKEKIAREQLQMARSNELIYYYS